MSWVFKGLRTGIKTTSYPQHHEAAAGVSPGFPVDTRLGDQDKAEGLAKRCPTRAIASLAEGMRVDRGSCVHCLRCRREPDDGVMRWDTGYEWAANASQDAVATKLEKAFGRSLHIRFVDAGACSACVSEARQLNNPYYNMHRLGFFITPTPRNADVLMVSGPVSNAMILPLLKAYEAMPEPKRVLAIGACAISGGVFGPSFAASGGVAGIVPVDVTVPGCPPPPLAILHGLLVLVGRKPAVQTIAFASSSEREAV